MLAGLFLGLLVLTRAEAASAASRPSFVMIQLDDFSNAHLKGRWKRASGQTEPAMKIVRNQLFGKGVSFTRYHAPVPVCSPSRASMLSGQYSHNHGVRRVGSDEFSDWPAFQANEILDHNLATWLQGGGYRTMHFGKFINDYAEPEDQPITYVPPGWDEWHADSTDESARAYYGYLLNVNGFTEGPFGSATARDPLACPAINLATCRYHTDAITTRALAAIKETPAEQPFFVHLGYHTPHGDNRSPNGPEPASRHLDTANGIPRPQVRGYNERNISDKPVWIRERPRIDRQAGKVIRDRYRRSIEALRSVDGSVGRLLDTLERLGRLDSTYFFLFSDNGYFHGEHRLTKGKGYPYEPAVRVPMVIRGPSATGGRVSDELVANHDIAPTVLSLAGVRPDRRMDGRSLVPFMTNPARQSRRPIMLEFFGARGGGTVPYLGGEFYRGIRIGPYKFIRHQTGARELYHLTKDPGELRNLARDSRYRFVERYMKDLLDDYRLCSAAECREPAPPWPVVTSDIRPLEPGTGSAGGFDP